MDPDWNRERKGFFEWCPSRSLLAALRCCQRHQGSKNLVRRALRFIAKRRLEFWCVVTGADIPVSAVIGGGLVMPHPNGIVIHKDAVIGVNCMIMQQVTLGQLAQDGSPRLGDAVYVGAGAKVLGRLLIGDNASIGTNAVVLKDVPGHATAVGVPARVILQSESGRGPTAS